MRFSRISKPVLRDRHYRSGGFSFALWLTTSPPSPDVFLSCFRPSIEAFEAAPSLVKVDITEGSGK